MRKYDAIVIGSGTAGTYMASRLAGAGMSVAIVERKLFGGTCSNVGCTPTKALVASARAAHLARRAADFGVTIAGAVGVDMRRVKARKDAIVAQRGGVEKYLRGLANVAVHKGHARFTAPHEVRVGDEALSAERIFLAVGGRAAVPPLPGIAEIPYLTNVSILELETLPRHLLIVGGSYIGLEFAQIFRRFGSAVTVIEMAPRLLSREDDDVSAAVRDILRGEGIEIRLGAQCIGFAKAGDAIRARLDCAEAPTEIDGSHLLLAVGRRPNTDDLGLENTGVALDDRGFIVVDDELRSSVPGIWALGDCNGRGAFTHTAFNDHELVAANLLEGANRRVSDRIPAYALFIDPPLGRAGLTDAALRQSGRSILAGRRPMTAVARAVEKSETQGFMKIAVEAESRQIVGAAILGPDGDEAIHSILDFMQTKAPYTVLERAMNIHPTVSELVPTVLGRLQPMDEGGGKGSS